MKLHMIKFGVLRSPPLKARYNGVTEVGYQYIVDIARMRIHGL